MAREYRSRRRALSGLAILSILSLANAQATTYYFSGAVQVTGSSSNSGSAAVQAQCPAGYPTGCSSIGAADYCCPSSNNCQWVNSQVACCPYGQTCSGAIGGAQGYTPQTSTYWQPTTTYYTPTTTYYQNGGAATTVGAGGVVITEQGATTLYTQAQQTTEANYGNGQYCSTLVEVGPNLPTTAAGNCGTVLIVAPAEAARHALGWVKLGAMVVGLQMLGALLLARR